MAAEDDAQPEGLSNDHPGYPQRIRKRWTAEDDWPTGWPPPTGWMSVNDVVAWILWRYPPQAFIWEEACYPGAAEWMHPAAVMEMLEAIAEQRPGAPATKAEVPEWLRFKLYDPAFMASVLGADRPDLGWAEQPGDLAAAARKLRADFTSDPVSDLGFAATYAKASAALNLPTDPEAVDWMFAGVVSLEYERRAAQYELMWQGAAELRHALASGSLSAFGWHAASLRRFTARSRIPAYEFKSPVCLTCDGVLPCSEEEAWRHDTRPAAIWTEVVMSAGDVLRVWPDRCQSHGAEKRAPPIAEARGVQSRSRKAAPNSLVAKDAPLVEEMRAMIRDGRAKGPWDAALALSGRAAGGGTVQSRAKRLLARYSERFGAEPFGED